MVPLTALGRVLYQNLMSCVPTVLVMAGFGELRMEALTALQGWALVWVMMSCLFGFGMCWTSWALRAQVSALSFTVIGVSNKLGSILINYLIWCVLLLLLVVLVLVVLCCCCCWCCCCCCCWRGLPASPWHCYLAL